MIKSSSTNKVPDQLGNRAVYSSVGAMQFSQHADQPAWLNSYFSDGKAKGRLGILGGINVGQFFSWLIIGLVTVYTFALIGGINRRDSAIVSGGGQEDGFQVSSPAELTNNAKQEDGVVAGASIEEGEQSNEQEDEPKEDEDGGVGEANEEDQRPTDVAPVNDGVLGVTQVAPVVNNPPVAAPAPITPQAAQPDNSPEPRTPSEPTKKVTTDIDPETGVETTTTVVNDNGTITTTVETLTPEEEVTTDNGLKVE